VSTLILRSPAPHLIYQSSVQRQVLHWAGPSSTVLRMRTWNPTKERAFIPLKYWRLFALSLSLSVLWLFGPYSGYGLPNFLPPILFSAADFQFRTWSTAIASFCTLFSHLLRDLPTSLLPPKLPPKIQFGMRWSYKFITWPAHLSLFNRIYFERGIYLYIFYSSAFYLILHNPCELVGRNIFRRIFRSKGSILFMACLGRVHDLLPYTIILWVRFYIMSIEIPSSCHDISINRKDREKGPIGSLYLYLYSC
jgi:hypothetical protein